MDNTTTEGKVKGTVKVNGAPMKGGEITFDPSSSRRVQAGPKTASVNADGTYEIATLVGKNDVRISGPAVTKQPELGYVTKTVDVAAGRSAIDLEFP